MAVLTAVACTARPTATPSALLPTASATAVATSAADATIPPLPSVEQLLLVESGDRWLRAIPGSVVGMPSLRIDSTGSIVVGMTVGHGGQPPRITNANLGGGELEARGLVDVVIGKFSPDGGHVWSRLYGGPDFESLGGLALAEDGSIVLTGTFNGALDFGGAPMTSAGEWDAFVARLDEDGDLLWSRQFGGPAGDSGSQIMGLADASMIVTGSFEETADLGTGPLVAEGDTDVFVARLDESGAVRWVRQFGGEGYDGSRALAVDRSTGDLVLALSFDDEPRERRATTLVRLSAADGAEIWSHRFETEGQVNPRSLTVADDGRIAMGGDLSAAVDFGGGSLTPNGVPFRDQDPRIPPTAFLAIFTADGSHLWSTAFGHPNGTTVGDLAFDADGGLLVSGTFEAALELGGALDPISAGEETGGYVARFGSDGDPVTVLSITDTADLGSVGAVMLGAFEGSDDLLVSGHFLRWLDLGFGGVRTSSEWYDFFIARIEAP